MAGFAKGLIHGGLIGSAGVLALALALPPSGDSARGDREGAPLPEVAGEAARIEESDSAELAGGVGPAQAGAGRDGGDSARLLADDVALDDGGTSRQADQAEAAQRGEAAAPAQGAVVEFAAPRGSEFARPDPHRVPDLPADATPPETGLRAALPDAPAAEPAPVSPDRADPPGLPAAPGPLPEAVARSPEAPAPQAGEEQATPRAAAPALAAAPGSDAALPPETAASPAPPEPAARTQDPQAAPPAAPAVEPALPQTVAQGETPRADSPALVQAAPDEAAPSDEAAARPGDIGTAPAMPQIGASAGAEIPQLPSGGSAPQRSAAPQLDTPRPVVETVPPPPPAADEGGPVAARGSGGETQAASPDDVAMNREAGEGSAGGTAVSPGGMRPVSDEAEPDHGAEAAPAGSATVSGAASGVRSNDEAGTGLATETGMSAGGTAADDGAQATSADRNREAAATGDGPLTSAEQYIAPATGRAENRGQPVDGAEPRANDTARPAIPRPIAPDLSVPRLNGLGL